MLSMLGTISPVNNGNCWKFWVDHIVKQKDTFGLQKACLVQHNGTVSASSKGFYPSSKEVQAINLLFKEKINNNIVSDRLSIKDKTYMIKTLSSTQIVAFSGAKYVIINRSKSKHVVAMCDAKDRYHDAATWLSKLSQKLVDKGF